MEREKKLCNDTAQATLNPNGKKGWQEMKQSKEVAARLARKHQ